MIKKLQYYIGSCTDPHRNLALEEYLTDTVGEDTCILYLWQNKHTVVIGRNQNAWQECRTTELERDSGTLARRLSGGGAVYHDMGNLNFTFSLRTQDYDLRKQQSVIVEACRSLGIPAEISGRNDILTNGCKFSGNSFYSHAGCSFHNGTLLVNVDMANLGKYLTPSKTKLESKGVASVRSRVINLTELKPDLTIDGMAQAMVKAFETVYGLESALPQLRLGLRQKRAVLVLLRQALCLGRGDDRAGGGKRRLHRCRRLVRCHGRGVCKAAGGCPARLPLCHRCALRARAVGGGMPRLRGRPLRTAARAGYLKI